MARGDPGESGYQPQVMPEDFPRKLTPRAEGTSLGPAMEQMGSALEAKYQADSATWAGDQLAQFRTQAVTALDQAKQNLPNGNPDGFTANFAKSFDAMAGPLASQAANNPVAGKMLGHGIQELKSTLLDHSVQWEAEQNVAFRTNSIDKNLSAQLPLIEAHPELAGQVGSTLADQMRATGAPPTSLLPALRNMDSQISLAAANGFTRQDPRAALQALNDPENATGAFKGVLSSLNDAQREAVRAKANEHLSDGVYSALQAGNFRGAQIALHQNSDLLDPKTADQLQRTINSVQEQQIAMHDKQQRDASDSLLKNAILMSQKGELTPAYIEKYHNVWEPQAYEYAYKLLSGKEVQDDPTTYVGLANQLSRGEDVRDAAMGAASNGLLKPETAVRFIEQSGKEMPNWQKRGYEYIHTAGQVSQLEPDPAKAQTLANMQNDWSNWTREHPNATDEEAEPVFRGIVSRYQLVKADQNMLTLPVPSHFVGSRTQPDLPATKAATFKALQNGDLTQDDFNREALLIQQWQHAYDAAQAKKASKAAKP